MGYTRTWYHMKDHMIQHIRSRPREDSNVRICIYSAVRVFHARPEHRRHEGRGRQKARFGLFVIFILKMHVNNGHFQNQISY